MNAFYLMSRDTEEAIKLLKSIGMRGETLIQLVNDLIDLECDKKNEIRELEREIRYLNHGITYLSNNQRE